MLQQATTFSQINQLLNKFCYNDRLGILLSNELQCKLKSFIDKETHQYFQIQNAMKEFSRDDATDFFILNQQTLVALAVKQATAKDKKYSLFAILCAFTAINIYQIWLDKFLREIINHIQVSMQEKEFQFERITESWKLYYLLPKEVRPSVNYPNYEMTPGTQEFAELINQLIGINTLKASDNYTPIIYFKLQITAIEKLESLLTEWSESICARTKGYFDINFYLKNLADDKLNIVLEHPFFTQLITGIIKNNRKLNKWQYRGLNQKTKRKVIDITRGIQQQRVRHYIEQRTAESATYMGLFSRWLPQADSKEHKLAAADKLHKALTNHEVRLTPTEHHAMKHGRLQAIFKHIMQTPPHLIAWEPYSRKMQPSQALPR